MENKTSTNSLEQVFQDLKLYEQYKKKLIDEIKSFSKDDLKDISSLHEMLKTCEWFINKQTEIFNQLNNHSSPEEQKLLKAENYTVKYFQFEQRQNYWLAMNVRELIVQSYQEYKRYGETTYRYELEQLENMYFTSLQLCSDAHTGNDVLNEFVEHQLNNLHIGTDVYTNQCYGNVPPAMIRFLNDDCMDYTTKPAKQNRMIAGPTIKNEGDLYNE